MAEKKAMLEPKIFRRDEVIFREDDPIECVYLVQSGVVSLSVERAGGKIEISQVNANHLLGEEALWGGERWTVTAQANNEVNLIPVDIRTALQLWRSALPLGRTLGQSLVEKHRRFYQALREIRLEEDATPCPPQRVTKLFAVLYHSALYTGTKKPGKITVVWPAFKKYCQRIFLESPVRLEQATNILVKLGYADLEFVPCETDPNAPDELGFVHFKNLDIVKTFIELSRKFQSGAKNAGTIDPAHQAIFKCIDDWNTRGKVSPYPDPEEGQDVPA